MHFIRADACGDALGLDLAVAGEHHDLFHAQRPQPGKGLIHVRTQAVAEHHVAQHPAVFYHP